MQGSATIAWASPDRRAESQGGVSGSFLSDQAATRNVWSMPKSTGRQSVFRLRIELKEVDPVVWRRLLVPGSIRLCRLAEMLLAAMGWENSHPHAFRVDDRLYGMHLDDYPDEEIDEKKVTVLQALGDMQGIEFDYDFGDGWEHQVTIEELSTSPIGLKYAVCLDGANACPPVVVGGACGYDLFLQALGDPDHEEHKSYAE
jgi:hypothetical protein